MTLLSGFIGLVNLRLRARDRHREMRDRRARTAISGAAVIGEFVAESVIFAGVGEVAGLVLGNGAMLAARAVLPDLWSAIGPGQAPIATPRSSARWWAPC